MSALVATVDSQREFQFGILGPQFVAVGQWLPAQIKYKSQITASARNAGVDARIVTHD